MNFKDIFNYTWISILTFSIGIMALWVFEINPENLIVLVLPPLSFFIGIFGMLVLRKEIGTVEVQER